MSGIVFADVDGTESSEQLNIQSHYELIDELKTGCIHCIAKLFVC